MFRSFLYGTLGIMTFILPQLPYSFDALEPYIDAKTMEIHYTKHHQAYVDNLNKALASNPQLSSKTLEDLLSDVNSIPEDIRQTVINNGGGHFNHSFFWETLTPSSTKEPGTKTKLEIVKTFSSFENFKSEFTTKALTLFGSGWVFLMIDKEKNLKIKRHSFQNNPLMQGNNPILGLDVWEHAYYLKYQNRRAEYVDAFWNIVNWEKVEEKLSSLI